MKIAFYHELHKGGARRAANEFAKQLKKNHQVDLYTIGEKKEDEKSSYTNIFFFEFKSKTWRGENWKLRLYKDTLELLNLFLLNRKIANIINSKNYDLIYVTSSQYIETPFILNFIKISKFFYCNDPYYRMIYEPILYQPKNPNIFKNSYENLNRFIRKYLDKWNVSKIDFLLAASKFNEGKFYRTYGKRGKVVYCGVDTDFFKPSRVNRDIDILFVGSYDNVLDGYSFFSAILKGIKMDIKTRVLAFENEWLNDKQMLSLYRRSKILVATSFNEPLGLVPLEAMACGTIVVALNEGGYKETVINEKTGFLADRDIKKFAEKIEWVLNNINKLNKLSKNARQKLINNWTWHERGKELERILISSLNMNKD